MRDGLIGTITALPLNATFALNGCNATTGPVGSGGSSSTGQTGGNGGSSTTPTFDPFPSPVHGNVGQYAACIIDNTAAFKTGASGLAGCATVILNDLPAVWDFVAAEPPASCATLNLNCAEVNYPTPR